MDRTDFPTGGVVLMAEHAGVSCHQVTQIWKAADLKPHRIRNFKATRNKIPGNRSATTLISPRR